MARKIDYNARNFAEVRSELVGFVKQYYPQVYSSFNDASVGMMLLELNAAVGDMLSYHTDRTFNARKVIPIRTCENVWVKYTGKQT
jgi:hypothetical protein